MARRTTGTTSLRCWRRRPPSGFVVAIAGHGDRHDATVRAYQQAAKRNQAQDKYGKEYVKVVSFDAVTDPQEIAGDLITLVS
jgi:hypothetical protein